MLRSDMQCSDYRGRPDVQIQSGRHHNEEVITNSKEILSVFDSDLFSDVKLLAKVFQVVSPVTMALDKEHDATYG